MSAEETKNCIPMANHSYTVPSTQYPLSNRRHCIMVNKPLSVLASRGQLHAYLPKNDITQHTEANPQNSTEF